MSEDKDVPVLDHNYDGIQEYDNPLPMWWLVTFFATIIFGFNYWIHYEFGGAKTQTQELASDLAEYKKNKKQDATPPASETDLSKLASAPETLAGGKVVFQAKCSVCHGVELEGGIGPNLTDEFWINGRGQPVDIVKVVREGVLDKGMPAWEALLKNEEVLAVAVYIASRKGSQPPNPKPPQGDKIAN